MVADVASEAERGAVLLLPPVTSSVDGDRLSHDKPNGCDREGREPIKDSPPVAVNCPVKAAAW